MAQALHLVADQRRYLFGPAGKETAKPRRRARQTVQPQLRRVQDDRAATPAIVRLRFSDPAMRTLYADWKSVARTAVAQLRMEAAKYPDDPRLTALVGELCVQDEDFRQLWAAHHVATLSVGTKVLHHPVAGELSLDWDTLTASTDPDQQLVVWTAEVGSPTHDGLRILASWAADRYRTAEAPTE